MLIIFFSVWTCYWTKNFIIVEWIGNGILSLVVFFDDWREFVRLIDWLIDSRLTFHSIDWLIDAIGEQVDFRYPFVSAQASPISFIWFFVGSRKIKKSISSVTMKKDSRKIYRSIKATFRSRRLPRKIRSVRFCDPSCISFLLPWSVSQRLAGFFVWICSWPSTKRAPSSPVSASRPPTPRSRSRTLNPNSENVAYVSLFFGEVVSFDMSLLTAVCHFSVKSAWELIRWDKTRGTPLTSDGHWLSLTSPYSNCFIREFSLFV